MAILTPEQMAAQPARGTEPRSQAGASLLEERINRAMTAPALLTPPEEVAQTEVRERSLRAELMPQNELEGLLVRQLAMASIEIEQTRGLLIDARQRWAERAEHSWATDRRLEAHETSKKLARDPEGVVKSLMATEFGAEWLLLRWSSLKLILEKTGEWTEPHRELAYNLLGLPCDFRACLSLEADTPEATLQLRLNLADRQIQKLDELIRNHLRSLDTADFDRACKGIEPSHLKGFAQLRRQARQAQKRFEWAWKELWRLKHAPVAPVEFEPETESESDELCDEPGRYLTDRRTSTDDLEPPAPPIAEQPKQRSGFMAPVRSNRHQRRAAAKFAAHCSPIRRASEPRSLFPIEPGGVRFGFLAGSESNQGTPLPTLGTAVPAGQSRGPTEFNNWPESARCLNREGADQARLLAYV